MNEINIKSMQTQINNVKNELRNEMKTSIQPSMSNQTNELKNMMASFFQMNIAFTSGSGPLPSNTIANTKGELKSITTQSGLVLDGPSVLIPPPFINPEEDERAKETLTDPELAEYTIKVPPPFVQKDKPPSQRNYVVHQRDPRHPHIPYPSRIKQEKQQEKDEIQIHKPFLRTAHALIDVHGEEMILRDGDERLALNMRHDTSSYSNQPHKESINMINIYNDSYEGYLKDLFATNHLSGNPTFSSHTNLTSPKVINPLSGNTTSSSPNHLLEEFADELTLIKFPLGNDDLPFDIESDLREIEYLLNHDPTKEMDSILEDSVDEYNDDVYDDPFDSKDDNIKESKLLIDELDPLRSNNDDVYDDPFDSKDDKIKESKLLIDDLDPLRS
nr:hypothetical protein [Tanacetum cinerariifolium]